MSDLLETASKRKTPASSYKQLSGTVEFCQIYCSVKALNNLKWKGQDPFELLRYIINAKYTTGHFEMS